MGENESTGRGAGGGRRSFLRRVSVLAMGAGLAGSYGTFGVIMGRFLYPAKDAERRLQFVTRVESVPEDGAIRFRSPAGATITVTRRGAGATAADFLALSSICPHLGCRVHWEGQNDRFFCPCHNGVFDRDGRPVSGPPADADQHLSRFPITVERGLVFIELELEGAASEEVS